MKRTVEFDLSTIPVDKYAKWRAWLQSVDGLMHRMVRLVPDGTGGAKVASAKTVVEKPDADADRQSRRRATGEQAATLSVGR